MQRGIASTFTAHLFRVCLFRVCLLSACLFGACLGWPQVVLAALPEGLAGVWRGVVEIDGTEAEVRLTLSDREPGFGLALTLPETPALRADFVASARPGVFEVATARRGLFGFFDDGDQSNPFDGEPLIWARASGLGVVAYRLTIGANGEMGLLRVALEPVGEGVQIEVDQRVDAGPPHRLAVQLQPAG